jgi:hypothetical protein
MLTGRFRLVLGLVVVALTSGQAHAAFQKATLHKVSEKSDGFKKNNRGKTGGLDGLFRVRAVMNADQSTDLYFEAGYDPNYLPPDGTDLTVGPQMRKVQIKVYEENGTFNRTENITIGKGAMVFHRTDFARHQRIDATATIDFVPYAGTPYDYSPTRTYVLSDSTTVLRRPDVAVVNVAAQPTQTLGGATQLIFTVKELYGDLPADGVCQADLSLPLSQSTFGQAYPVGFAVDPGQTVDCAVDAFWTVTGSWTWRARAHGPGPPPLLRRARAREQRRDGAHHHHGRPGGRHEAGLRARERLRLRILERRHLLDERVLVDPVQQPAV